MRRTILLGAVTPIVALGVLAWTQATLLAQSPKAEPPKSVPVPLQSATTPFAAEQLTTSFEKQATTSFAQPAPQPISKVPVGDGRIRRFLELSEKRARAFSEEQLKHEIEVLEKDVNETEAWARAEEIARSLHELMLKHPDTKAAEAASGAIRCLQHQHAAAHEFREGVNVSKRTFKRGVIVPERSFKREPEDARPGATLNDDPGPSPDLEPDKVKLQ